MDVTSTRWLTQTRNHLTSPDVDLNVLRRDLEAAVHGVELLTRQLDELQERLEQEQHCPLTGLWTRGAWTDRAELILGAGPALVCMVDLDEFKAVNDTHGHQAGDAVLMAIASRLDDWAEALGGVAGRIGGDEFVVAVPDGPGVLHALDELHQTLTAPIGTRHRVFEVGASLGLVEVPAGAGPRDAEARRTTALSVADREMYAMKAARRGGQTLDRRGRLVTAPTGTS